MTKLITASHESNRTRYNYGSNKKILTELINFIDSKANDIEEIYLCLYLYNNEVLHNKMKALADSGIKVKVISIPLEGYDDSPDKARNIIDAETNRVIHQNATKYSLAKSVYDDITAFNSPNYELYVFEHIFVRSSSFRRFSRGRLPYSLHNKSAFIKMRDGSSVTALTSANLAVNDPSKDEVLILMDDTPDTKAASESFFSLLLENSCRSSDWHNPHPDYLFEMNCTDDYQLGQNCFTAPFLNESPVRISDRISDIIDSARRRIYICAEHLAALDYPDMNRNNTPGIFSHVFERCRQNVPVKLLSQTFVDADGNSHSQLSPENPEMYQQFTQSADGLNWCAYAVNRNVHAKFIVADDTVIITSANLTPTQFLYGPVTIEHFRAPGLEGVSYEGIFSEVAQYIILEDHNLAEQLIRFFNAIERDKDTYIHKPARFYINCPFAEKDDAKAIGGKWDPDKEKWYFTVPEKAPQFMRWV